MRSEKSIPWLVCMEIILKCFVQPKKKLKKMLLSQRTRSVFTFLNWRYKIWFDSIKVENITVSRKFEQDDIDDTLLDQNVTFRQEEVTSQETTLVPSVFSTDGLLANLINTGKVQGYFHRIIALTNHNWGGNLQSYWTRELPNLQSYWTRELPRKLTVVLD